MKKPFPKTLSAGVVSEILEISTKEVRQLCKTGELEAFKIENGHKWHIVTEQLIHSHSAKWETYLERLGKYNQSTIDFLEHVLESLNDKIKNSELDAANENENN